MKDTAKKPILVIMAAGKMCIRDRNKDAAIKVAVSALDAAKNKGVIHKNTCLLYTSRCV